MAGQNTNTDWQSSLFAVTLDQYKEELTNNFFDARPALKLIRAKSKVGARKSGGNLIVPLMVGDNDSAKSYNGYDSFDLDPQKGFVDASVQLTNYGVPVVISDEELDINNGKEQVVSILSSKIMQAEMSITNNVGNHLFLDGTGNGGKNILGFGAMCEETATPGEYMNYTDATNWVNQYQTGSQGEIIDKMDALYRSISDGVDKTDIIVCSSEFLAQYEAACRTAGISTIAYPNASNADAGFADAHYKGIPIVIDKAIDDSDTAGKGKAYFLMSKYLGLYMEAPVAGKMIPIADSFAQVSKIKTRLQLFTSRRNRQGVIVLS